MANRDRDVIAASVNAGYIDFAMNWLCSISEMGIKVSASVLSVCLWYVAQYIDCFVSCGCSDLAQNYFMIATDKVSYDYLHSRGYVVWLIQTDGAREGLQHTCRWLLVCVINYNNYYYYYNYYRYSH